jgi:ubiquinone/menaquinone biosynthesis C-methylase UbiE
MSDLHSPPDSGFCPPRLEPVEKLLCCPYCAGGLAFESAGIRCGGCQAVYPLHDGVPMLAREGTAESWEAGAESSEDSSDYQQAYQEVAEAELYNRAYQDEMLKRWSTRREFRLLDRLLASQGRSELLLDLPCGGGRLSPRIGAHTDLLIEADIAVGQVLYGQRHSKLDTPQIWMTASAFHIPFRDNSVDGVVCCRLCHHLPTPVERERLVEELLRVSRRFVVMTFFDFYSLKNWLRRARRPFNKKPPKMTMTVQRVRELAEANGARLVQYPMLAPTSSGHRYALMVKDG